MSKVGIECSISSSRLLRRSTRTTLSLGSRPSPWTSNRNSKSWTENLSKWKTYSARSSLYPREKTKRILVWWKSLRICRRNTLRSPCSSKTSTSQGAADRRAPGSTSLLLPLTTSLPINRTTEKRSTKIKSLFEEESIKFLLCLKRWGLLGMLWAMGSRKLSRSSRSLKRTLRDGSNRASKERKEPGEKFRIEKWKSNFWTGSKVTSKSIT